MKQSTLRVYPIERLLELYDSHKLLKTQQLAVLLDKLYNHYIRTQSNTCVLSSVHKKWQCSLVIQCGHVFSSTCLALRYDERNTYPQCSTCNYMHSMGSDHIYYHNWLKQKIGIQEYTKLEHIYASGAPVKLSKQWYIDKIEHYKALYKKGTLQ